MIHSDGSSACGNAGKSAILQAMQFCLGVNAQNTGRASNASQLIRAGASHAKASITLWNTGEDAYMPAFFGCTITIEREIRASTGASSYTIRKQDGSKVRLWNVQSHFTNEPAQCFPSCLGSP